MIFQLPLKIRNMPICTPKTTAAVDNEAANFSILWFSWFWAAPVPVVPEGVVDDWVADIVNMLERYASAIRGVVVRRAWV